MGFWTSLFASTMGIHHDEELNKAIGTCIGRDMRFCVKQLLLISGGPLVASDAQVEAKLKKSNHGGLYGELTTKMSYLHDKNPAQFVALRREFLSKAS